MLFFSLRDFRRGGGKVSGRKIKNGGRRWAPPPTGTYKLSKALKRGWINSVFDRMSASRGSTSKKMGELEFWVVRQEATRTNGQIVVTDDKITKSSHAKQPGLLGGLYVPSHWSALSTRRHPAHPVSVPILRPRRDGEL